MNERSAHQVLCDSADEKLEREIDRLGRQAEGLKQMGRTVEASRVIARQGLLIAKRAGPIKAA